MPFRFALPDLGEGVAEGEILRFLVAVGDEVAEDDPLVEVETDKAGVDIPSPVAGRVLAVHGAPGDVVPVGTVLVEIAVDGEEPEAAPPPSEAAPPPSAAAPPPSEAASEGVWPLRANPTPVAATPRVRQLAKELGVDLAAVAGTGPEGRVTEADVRGAAATPGPRAAPGRGVVPETAPGSGVAPGSRSGPGIAPGSRSRRTIARRLTEAAAVPTVTNVDDCAFDAVRAAEVSPLVAVARACAVALGEHPRLNAWAVDGELHPQPAVHLGVATQTDRGLAVPVVRNAADLALDDLATAITTATTAAREGRVAPEDLRGSTFTITSAGRQAGLFSTPLLNLPEVAILGLYRLEPRPVVRDGAVVVATMANLSITFDHRVLDGLDAAAFLARVEELLETWPRGV